MFSWHLTTGAHKDQSLRAMEHMAKGVCPVVSPGPAAAYLVEACPTLCKFLYDLARRPLCCPADDDEIADLLSSGPPKVNEGPGVLDKASDLAQVSHHCFWSYHCSPPSTILQPLLSSC